MAPWDPTAPGSTSQQDNQGSAETSATATIVASAARTASGNSGSHKAVSGADSVSVYANVTAVSGTTPSMTLAVEWSNDGTDWFPGDTLGAAITAATKRQQTVAVRAALYRVVWTITGTTPSFTFSVSTHQLV